MKKKYFGTDGIRGHVNQYPITSSFFLDFSLRVSKFIKKSSCKVIIGKDTRNSCDMIENSLVSGFCSTGVNVSLIGISTTPLLSYMTKVLKGDLGIMISASHNPYYDNGIKIFNNKGEKLSDDEELKIEEIIKKKHLVDFCLPNKIGKTFIVNNFSKYKNNIFKIIPSGVNFKNIKMVVDCANGSAFRIAPEIFTEFGIDLILDSTKPNGININSKCGALFSKNLSKKVVLNNADIGIAFDGDADRLIVSDEKGKIINGDKILAIASTYLQKQEKLKSKYIVSTHMANLGLSKYLESNGLKLFKTPVGDKYVSEGMRKKNSNLGGEQSGHIIFSDLSPSGDGIMTAFLILSIMKLSNRKLSQILQNFNIFPQKLVNLKLSTVSKKNLRKKKFLDLINNYTKKLGKNGSVLVRKSGTEDVLRIMAQSENLKLTKKITDDLTNFLLCNK